MIPKLPSWIRAVCVLPELHEGFGHQAFGEASDCFNFILKLEYNCWWKAEICAFANRVEMMILVGFFLWTNSIFICIEEVESEKFKKKALLTSYGF